MKNEGWDRVLIKTPLEINQTGVYRPALPLLLKELHKAGGVSAVKPFSERYDASGRRVFSAPWDSNAMKKIPTIIITTRVSANSGGCV